MPSQKKVRVAVNGYGAIGKRVAEAIRLQDDMVLRGISDVATDWRMRIAIRSEAFYAYLVDSQAIVSPETIDAIRALTGLESDPGASIAKTNASLDVRSRLIRSAA